MTVETNQALHNLVTQFRSALDFYRELVQNSIDAGSNQIDVWLEHLPDDGGTIAIHVDDYGEGMDESIIDNQLTTLFSSTKENDLTKIGKFGIGFVSVFAMKPKAVQVRTGRGGEWWEVLFAEDRSFSKSRIDTPAEGTQITLLVDGDRRRHEELVEASRQTLERWCRHSDTEVTFEDRSDPRSYGPRLINQPFAVEGYCPVRVEHQGTEIAVAYSHEPSYGFFNKGLTLSETVDAEEAFGERAGRFAHMGVKIKSRYLEHTLSRETVMKDQNYEKAVALITDAVRGPLVERLTREISALASTESLEADSLDEYFELIDFLGRLPPDLLLAQKDSNLIRTLHGGPLSLLDVLALAEREGRVFIAALPSRLTSQLHELGLPVLMVPVPASRRESARQRLVGLFGAMRSANERRLSRRIRRFGRFGGLSLKAAAGPGAAAEGAPYLIDPSGVMLVVEIHEAGEEAGILQDTRELLRADKAGPSELGLCSLVEGAAPPPLFVVGPRLGPLMAPPPHAGAARRGAGALAINRDHPHFQRLLAAYADEPSLAAYCLARCLLMKDDEIDANGLDSRMLARARRLVS